MPFVDAEGVDRIAFNIKNKYAGKNADGAVVSVGADYAEYGDWYDGNTSNQDRKGYFVTMRGGTNQIEIANSASAIVGVTTDSAGFIGNYVKGAETDKSKGLVGIVGQVSVIDNGTCAVGGRCMPADDGTAEPSSNNCGYLVIERIDTNHVRILVSPTIDMVQRIKTDMVGIENVLGNVENAIGKFKEIGVLDWQFDGTVQNGGGNEPSVFSAQIDPEVHGFSVSDILFVHLERTWPLQRWSDNDLSNRLGATFYRGCIVSLKDVDYDQENNKIYVKVTSNTAQNYNLRFKIIYAK